MMEYRFSLLKLIRRYMAQTFGGWSNIVWLRTILAPLARINNELLAFEEECRTEILQNGQVVRLLKLLNDRFDSEQRRIRIVDASNKAQILSNISPTIISDSVPTIINDISDFDSSVDFIIRLPAEVIGSKAVIVSDVVPLVISDSVPTYFFDITSDAAQQLNDLVKRYKITGKSYKIETLVS